MRERERERAADTYVNRDESRLRRGQVVGVVSTARRVRLSRCVGGLPSTTWQRNLRRHLAAGGSPIDFRVVGMTDGRIGRREGAWEEEGKRTKKNDWTDRIPLIDQKWSSRNHWRVGKTDRKFSAARVLLPRSTDLTGGWTPVFALWSSGRRYERLTSAMRPVADAKAESGAVPLYCLLAGRLEATEMTWCRDDAGNHNVTS